MKVASLEINLEDYEDMKTIFRQKKKADISYGMQIVQVQYESKELLKNENEQSQLVHKETEIEIISEDYGHHRLLIETPKAYVLLKDDTSVLE